MLLSEHLFYYVLLLSYPADPANLHNKWIDIQTDGLSNLERDASRLKIFLKYLGRLALKDLSRVPLLAHLICVIVLHGVCFVSHNKFNKSRI